MKTKIILGLLLILAIGCENSEPIPYPSQDYTGLKGKIYDSEGNVYKTIGVGMQIWMAENLRSTRLNDNTEIKILKDSTDWVGLSSPAYCWYNNDSTLKIPYGALYNWDAVKSGKLCPVGWHVPSDTEWSILVEKLGGKKVAGAKLKVIGPDYWIGQSTGATNSSHFNAVPGGGNFYSQFLGLGKWSHWWSETRIDTSVTTVDLLTKAPEVLIGPAGLTRNCALSIRCIKDQRRN